MAAGPRKTTISKQQAFWLWKQSADSQRFEKIQSKRSMLLYAVEVCNSINVANTLYYTTFAAWKHLMLCGAPASPPNSANDATATDSSATDEDMPQLRNRATVQFDPEANENAL